MFWITKYRHNKIVEEYKEALQIQKENLNRKEKFESICDKLTDISDKLTTKYSDIIGTIDSYAFAGTAGELVLPDNVPVYVDDYFGGKVIKQESHPVTILDETGKATYGVTAKKLPKGQTYHLVTIRV